MTSPHPILPVAMPLGWASGGARHTRTACPVFFDRVFFRIRWPKPPAKVARPQARATSGAAGVVDAPAVIGGPRHG